MALVSLRPACLYRGHYSSADVSAAVRRGQWGYDLLASPFPSTSLAVRVQVLLEWSKEKYEYQFSIYADNIAGKSYET